MANYYVSTTRGSDSAGTGSATSPWKTIGKAIGSSPAITLSGTGDALYIEPGVYRELVALGLSPTAAGPLAIVGDGDGAGFKAGGYSSPVTGVVEIRAWTDAATPMTTGEVLSANAKSYVAVRNIKMIGGNGSGNACFNLTGTFSDWSFEDCIFIGSATRAGTGAINGAAGAALNVSFKRCDFVGVAHSSTYYGVQLRTPLNSTEYNVNVVFQNCNFFGTAGAVQVVQVGGVGTGWSTGIRVQQCGFWFCYRGVHVGSNPTLTTPIGVYGCTFMFIVNGVVVTTPGQVVEDGNAYACNINLSAGITAGTHSIATACPAFNLHDERLYGGVLRPYLEPSAVSPFLGAGNYGSPPNVDLYNRGRPEGGGSAVASIGSIERHDTGARNTTFADAGSPACLALVGPSSQERPILVNAQATTISVKVRWDGNHGDASKPQVKLLANPEVGVSAQTVTAASTGGTGGSPNGYETLTFAPITPTAAGVVMLRMISRSASGAGAAYFDTITLS